jgi:hypothetical protein
MAARTTKAQAPAVTPISKAMAAADARQAAQQAKAREALKATPERAAKVAAATKATKAPSAKATAKALDQAVAAKAKAPAKAPATDKAPSQRGTTAAELKALTPAAGHTSKDAARIGQPAGKGLDGYFVRWPHATYDALVRATDAKGEGAPWLARCNAHGETAEAANMQEALKLGKRDALADWCKGHKAEAAGAKVRAAVLEGRPGTVLTVYLP